MHNDHIDLLIATYFYHNKHSENSVIDYNGSFGENAEIKSLIATSAIIKKTISDCHLYKNNHNIENRWFSHYCQEQCDVNR